MEIDSPMGGCEFVGKVGIPQSRQSRRIYLDGNLKCLPHDPHLGRELECERAVEPHAAKFALGLVAEFLKFTAKDSGRFLGQRRAPRYPRNPDIVRRKKTERRDHAGIRRHDDLAYAELFSDLGREQWTCAPE